MDMSTRQEESTDVPLLDTQEESARSVTEEETAEATEGFEAAAPEAAGAAASPSRRLLARVPVNGLLLLSAVTIWLSIVILYHR